MTLLAISEAGSGFGLGLILAALVLGLRHGIDWDHIAAITDVTAAQSQPRRSVFLGTMYALGHAAVVFVIGTVVIVAGQSLPTWVDDVMGRIVGWTLIVLGVYVIYALLRFRGEFRMRSRWMLLFDGVRAGYRGITARWRPAKELSHEHEHVAVRDVHHEPSDDETVGGTRFRAPTHVHEHRHAGDPAAAYGTGTAVGVGMLHGVGAETPTQVLVFLAAANAGGAAAGIMVLAAFLVGLVLSNSAITLGSVFTMAAARRRRTVQLVLGAATAVVSLVVGTLFILGSDALLPAFFAG